MINHKNGQGTLLFVTVLCAIGTIFILNSSDIQKRNYTTKAKDYDQILLNEVTSSAFAVMESALARRLWEPPPDGQCLKADTFDVRGELAGGMSWKVSAKYNASTKNYELVSEGSYRGLTAYFLKRIKILDVSDYLLFSGSDQEVLLRRIYNADIPAALIARDRRIYTKGRLSFGGHIHRNNPMLDWNGSPAGWPGEFGTIIQGDRMQFAGGLHYMSWPIPKPNPHPSNIETLLAPFDYDIDEPQTYRGQAGGGYTLITRDHNRAVTLKNQVSSGATTPLTKASIANQVYPTALFGGSPPLKAWEATDSGSYFNNPDRASIFLYGYYGESNFGVRTDATCIAKGDALSDPNGKYCSYSEHFPKGFKAWRNNAGLEGTLFTADSEEVPSPKLSWDNMEALEEDARQCGLVLESPTSTAYKDCDLWDANFLQKYVEAGGSDICEQVSRINLDALSLTNFDPGQLSDASLKDRLLRRVIYTKVRAEVAQNAAKGLMTTSLPSNTARNNFALWIVSEDTLALRGYQADTTSPLNADPGRLREVVFNKDTTSSGQTSLPLVLLSPEQVHLISPQYVPASYSYMQSYWPVSGGKVRPVLHSHTDYVRQEDDGFKFGYRKFILEHISLITSSKISASYPFALRGLWSAQDSSSDQFVSNQCMVSRAGFNLQPYNGQSLIFTAQIPSYHSLPNSPIPPPSSRYYNGKNYFPYIYYADVFEVQRNNGHSTRIESDLLYTGIRMYAEFDSTTIAGKRNLSTPTHSVVDSRLLAANAISLGHKHYKWDSSMYYHNVPAGTSCVPENVTLRGNAAMTDSVATQPKTNDGRYIFVHGAPPDYYRNLGAIIGVDQPILETRK